MKVLGIVMALVGFYLTGVASACDAPHLHSPDSQLASHHGSTPSQDNFTCPVQQHHHHGHSTECCCFAPLPHAVTFSADSEDLSPVAPIIILPVDLEPAKTDGLVTTEVTEFYIDSGPPPSARPSIFCIFLI